MDIIGGQFTDDVKLMPSFLKLHQDKWRCSVGGLNIYFSDDISWWVRFWTRVFFRAKWKRL